LRPARSAAPFDDRRGDAAQDVDLGVARLCPCQQPPQPRHQPLRLRRVEVAERHQRLLEVDEHALDAVVARRRLRNEGVSRRSIRAEERQPALVGGPPAPPAPGSATPPCIGGDRAAGAAALDVLVGQAVAAPGAKRRATSPG